MKTCFFVTDLHGQIIRYRRLFDVIRREKPAAVFMGGDLLPHGSIPLSSGHPPINNFILDFLEPGFNGIKNLLGEFFPRVFLILGNDDLRTAESDLASGEKKGAWNYISNGHVKFEKYAVYGYSMVPPTPFLLKDWERYDVSRFVDPGCISPEEGWRSIPVSKQETRHATIQGDLEQIVGNDDLSNAIFLFHSPPYRTDLDRLAVAGKSYDHAPLDEHAGSIAIKRFIESHQPLLTLHGHIHESTQLSGSWKCKIRRTHCFSAAHHGPELALVRFDPSLLEDATRELIP